MGPGPILGSFQSSKEKENTERIKQEEIPEKKRKPDEGDKERRGGKCSQEGTKQIQAITHAVVLFFS
jgi:hypothetical protein